MVGFFAFLGVPLLAGLGACVWPHRKSPAERKEITSVFVALLAVGLFAAGPFLTTSGIGTGEAFNYSLSTADFVTQARDGVYPPLVGQSEFAFNGRIHPLRTAPYIGHFAELVDLATGRSLNFWAIQNLEIAASLIFAVFSMYVCLRRATAASRPTAAVLAACYGLAPGVLSVTYAMDLYMTVMTLPWVPVVLSAAIGLQKRCSFEEIALLAIGLGVSWEAHPPVAFWLTIVSALVLLPPILAGRIRGRQWLYLAAGAAFCGCIAGFGFVSALTVRNYGQISEASNVELLLGEVRRVFGDSLRPVSPAANGLGDFQLGYLYWAFLALACAGALVRRRLLPLWLTVITGFLLVLTTPVPFVTEWIWKHVPAITVTLTNQWPMQRLYLVATALILFAVASVYPRSGPIPRQVRDAAFLAILAAAAWTGFQAYRFVGRGFSARLPEGRSALLHRPENINLTIVSYAILGAPPFFDSGPMDPAMEFRLLRRFDARPIAGNWTAAEAQAGPVQKGSLDTTINADGSVATAPKLILEPGRRYMLTVALSGPPRAGTLQLAGRSLYREYPVQAAASSWGFGVGEGLRRPIALWTTGSRPEEVEVRFLEAADGTASGDFADFRLKEIDTRSLPVVLESLVPLRMRVRAPEACYLETPRLFLEGYRAAVDGKDVRVQGSPDGLAMFAVPAGESTVVLDYAGPVALRAAFYLTFGASLVAAALLVLVFVPGLDPVLGRVKGLLRGAVSVALRRGWPLALVALMVGALGVGVRHWNSSRPQAGPLHIRLVLPRGQTNRQQPVLVTGKKSAGTFVYLVYQDAAHVRVGVDVWGVAGFQSEPIGADYFAEQDLVISTGALYPEGSPALRGLQPAVLADLRGHIRVDLNGVRVVDKAVQDYPAKPGEIDIGRSRIGGSNCEPSFTGAILSVERLGVPAR
jgi:hypothetical protein